MGGASDAHSAGGLFMLCSIFRENPLKFPLISLAG